MGGRGAVSGFVSRLPNYQRAIVLQRKVKDYLLNPDKSKGKYKLFRGIGYKTMHSAARLEKDIRAGLKDNNALKFKPNEYGHTVYNVTMQLGIGEKTSILTVWQIDKGTNRPRFITAYKERGT